MAIQQQVNYPFLPLSGPFGFGNIQIYSRTGSWVPPPGINRVRARMWGAGAGSNTSRSGGGGAFSIVVVENLVGVESIPVIVGTPILNELSWSSSFGTYATATGGLITAQPAQAYGGYINNFGGLGGTLGGGGAASIMGPGGNAQSQTTVSQGGAGAGSSSANTNTNGHNGFLGMGASGYVTNGILSNATTGFGSQFSIDFIGMGGGGSVNGQAANGGGGSFNSGSTLTFTSNGSFPGGGGANTSSSSYGGNGLVIVEW